jgi:hypothetical protein
MTRRVTIAAPSRFSQAGEQRARAVVAAQTRIPKPEDERTIHDVSALAMAETKRFIRRQRNLAVNRRYLG